MTVLITFFKNTRSTAHNIGITNSGLDIGAINSGNSAVLWFGARRIKPSFSSLYLTLLKSQAAVPADEYKIPHHRQYLPVMWHFSDPLKFKSIKAFILILSLIFGQTLFAQTKKINADFYFRYSVSGLGSNMGSLMPTLEIHKTEFVYKKEQNSYYGKRSKKPEFISNGFIQQSSIDSILLLVSKLKDSTIYKTNPCIMSGGITYVTIAHGTDTTKFTLYNTSDYVVLKIVDILNPYLPKDKKLYESIEEIKNEEECWASLRERVEKQKSDSLKAKQ